MQPNHFTENMMHFGLLMTTLPLILIDRFVEWLSITPEGRQCWNITLQDDDTFDLQDRNTHENFRLRIAFYSTSISIRNYYTWVFTVEDERGKLHNVEQFYKDSVIIQMK